MKEIKILIVDDEFHAVENLERKIKALGHDCIGDAVNVEEALCIIKEKKPELVFLDLELCNAEEGGFFIAKYMKEVYPDIPFIFYSKFAEKRLKSAGLVKEPYSFIRKGVDEKELGEFIEYKLKIYYPHRFIEIPPTERLDNKFVNNIYLDLKKRIFILKRGSEYTPQIRIANLVLIETSTILRGVVFYYYHNNKISSFRIRGSITKVMKVIRKAGIIQIHQSHAINPIHMAKLSGGFVILNLEDKKLPIGGEYEDEFNAAVYSRAIKS